jgi:hypothetical protein
MRNRRQKHYIATRASLSTALDHLVSLRAGATDAEKIALDAITDAASNALGMTERTIDVGLASYDPASRLHLVC